MLASVVAKVEPSTAAAPALAKSSVMSSTANPVTSSLNSKV